MKENVSGCFFSEHSVVVGVVVAVVVVVEWNWKNAEAVYRWGE